MQNPFKFFFLILLFSLVLFLFSGGSFFVSSELGSLYGVFSRLFEEKISSKDLKQEYDGGKVKILIVPGHDNFTVGAQFKNIRETDLNIELAFHLLDFFKKDSKFDVHISRDKNGNYSNWFSSYLAQNKGAIEIFREYYRSVGSFAESSGWTTREAQVLHNPAADNTSLNLYAVNKWANDNDVDIVLHLHFNDYPRKWHGAPGKYTGFAIYVPGNQLPNFRVSNDLAEAIKNRLGKHFAKSSFPGEADTVVEDHELIAIGSNASRKGASLLIEYGYIYESQFINSGPRFVVMKELAAQTYWAIKDYFITSTLDVDADTTLLPHEWNLTLKKGMKGLKDIVHLQSALLKEGLYPSVGKTLSDCPINGNFGPCTEKAVKAFQVKYGISPVGIVGPKTLEKLNELYNN